MSLRAIAKVLGVDPATVHRALGKDPAETVDADEPAPIRGRDGKSYRRRRRRQVANACSICGERHDESPDQCPWDLFAQGGGRGPFGRVPDLKVRAATGMARTSWSRSRRGRRKAWPPARIRPGVDAFPVVTIVDSVTRAVCLVDELATLPQLVDEIEVAGATAGAGLVNVIRELIEHLRAQAATMVALVGRLERITPPVIWALAPKAGLASIRADGVALVSNSDADNVIHHGLE